MKTGLNPSKSWPPRLLVAALIVSLSGCGVTVPRHLPDPEVLAQKTVDEATDNWSLTPAIQIRRIRSHGMVINGPTRLPAEIASRSVQIELPHGSSMDDLSLLLATQGISMILSSDEGLNDVKTHIPHYQGQLGNLLEAVSLASDVSFEWTHGVILVRKGRRYAISLPQDENLIKSVTEELTKLGAESVSSSRHSGSVSFKTPIDHESAILDYVERITRNMAMINIQLAVINVALNRDANQGIDWSAFEIIAGKAVNLAQDVADTVTNPTTMITDPTTGELVPSPVMTNPLTQEDTLSTNLNNAARPLAMAYQESNATIVVGGNDFRMSALISFLSTYGNTETAQNLVLKTLSGNTVKIKNGRSTPYVSEISVGALSTGVNYSGGMLGGTQTEKAETGLDIELVPVFDANTGLVTVNMNIELSTIIAFLELSAGAQLGTLTQPDIQEQSFNDVARIHAGETVVLGGLIYDQMSSNSNTIRGMEDMPIGGVKNKMQRSALFVVLRPTVTIYDFSDTPTLAVQSLMQDQDKKENPAP